MDHLIKEMREWILELTRNRKITHKRGSEIWSSFEEECKDTSEAHAWDLAEQEIKFALNEKEQPLKSKLELYDKIGVPFTGGFPVGNDTDFGTSME